MKKLFVGLLVCLSVSLFVGSMAAADLSLDEIFGKIQANQDKIKDMYAETKTTIVSDLKIPGAQTEGPQKMVQTSKMWSKGETKSRIEMLSPVKQTTINNGDKTAIIDPAGRKTVKDMGKLRGKDDLGGSGVSLEKVKSQFNLSSRKTWNEYIVTGVPKKENKFLARIEFRIDPNKMAPTRIFMYGPKDKLLSRSEIEYQQIAGLWVPKKNKSLLNTPAGRMDVEVEFMNVKVNQGVSDKEFEIK